MVQPRTFDGIYLAYPCPFCGKPKTRGGKGQSILWIAGECIAEGFAISHCDTCGKAFIIPAAIFSDDILAEFDKVSQWPGDHLYGYVTEIYVKPGVQSRLLRADWYEVLLKANQAGPVDTMSIPWKPGEKCPNCGKGPNSPSIAFSYTCPACGVINSVTEQDIHRTLGVRVLCRNCSHPLLVPARVWCPKCNRALLDYYDVLRCIAGENGVPFEKLDPEIAAADERENVTPDLGSAAPPPDPIQTAEKGVQSETVPSGPVKIRKVSDFLKLVGMRVLFATRLEGDFEATVRDLSEMGTHILLDDVLCVDYGKEPYGSIVRVACRDIGNPDDLSKYVGQRIRLKMEPAGFVEGVLQSIPKSAKQVELAKMVTYYYPSDRRSLLIGDLTFIEVTDRKEIRF